MLYKNLRFLRESRGLKQENLAMFLNVTRASYSAYETDKRQMSHDFLCKIADFYGVSTDFILGRDRSGMFICDNDERVLVEKFRDIDKRAKETVCCVLDFEFNRTK